MPRYRRRQRNPRPANADDLLSQLGELTARAREEIERQRARVELAEALQRGMLPRTLPDVPELRVAARYAPARHGLDIGGDWYDAFLLDNDCLALSIGDVQGHDVDAAAFMGQIRIVLRAVAATASADPGDVLSTANDLLIALDSPLFATCSFLRVDPRTWQVWSARAGHTSAVWAHEDGGSGVIEDPGGPPLAVQSGERYPVTQHTFPPHGMVALLTDGVVEGPTFSIDEGLGTVARILQESLSLDTEEVADKVMEVAEMTGHSDDAAVLVLSRGAPEVS
ncbi:PP2C family protein-serine/threonine phosphatase [Streptomyces iconiensis]|uniref:PP2C family protein-serine/threonine phosphatase n=1 Tax=Streptomyces iconiensis TaxID=1384038 RepID=A0ABT7A3W5_9ACTN|nr:PP2C family protein-serine/threonine phosphatase [Streptomyces iconiensis]MDJ1136027.1 PP2C family protein-serine/threonine phosphatase [Streptomyces iconiensis]